MSTNKPKRPSRAAFARQLAAQQAETRDRDLPIEHTAVIDAYAPAAKSGRPMDLIRPFLHEVVTASSLTGTDSVRKHCTHLTELCRYSLSRGIPLTIPTVMTTAVIDEFIRVDMAGRDDHIRAERRRRLLAMAATVNPGPDAPAKLTPIAHSAVKPPYTPAELVGIIRVARHQPTDNLRVGLSTLVACAAGAGADSVDLRHGLVAHVEDTGRNGILLHVQGPRPRVVPVRTALEELMREAVAGRRPAEQLLVGKIDRRNTAARTTERAALIGVPHIEPARLRATWLADLMTDPIPVGLILRAAGLKSARTLAELQPHLGAWLAHKGIALDSNQGSPAATDVLRGEG